MAILDNLEASRTAIEAASDDLKLSNFSEHNADTNLAVIDEIISKARGLASAIQAARELD